MTTDTKQNPAGMTWQPIETAPKDGRSIDLLVNVIRKRGRITQARVPGARWSAADHWWVTAPPISEYVTDHPTHWQPLPNPPEKERT